MGGTMLPAGVGVAAVGVRLGESVDVGVAGGVVTMHAEQTTITARAANRMEPN